MYPDEVRIPGSPYTKFVSVTRDPIPWGPIKVVNACGTKDADEGRGCRDFILQIGLSWCHESEVPDPLRKRHGLSRTNVLRRRQGSDEQTSDDIADTVFECFTGVSVPSDGVFPTTISPAMETKFSLETDTATSLLALVTSAVDSGTININLDTDTAGASGTATTVGSVVSPTSTPTPTPATSNPQIAPDSGKPGGNAPSNSPANPADGSGTNTNPQDPYANAGPGTVNPPKMFIRSLGDRLRRLFI